MGNIMTFTGICLGSLVNACRIRFNRSRPLTVAPRGSRTPWVGNESTIKYKLSGNGDMFFTTSNKFSRLLPPVGRMSCSWSTASSGAQRFPRQRFRLGVEGKNLIFGIQWQLRHHPFYGTHGTLPLRRLSLALFRHIASA